MEVCPGSGWGGGLLMCPSFLPLDTKVNHGIGPDFSVSSAYQGGHHCVPHTALQPPFVTACDRIRAGRSPSTRHTALAIPRAPLDRMFAPGQFKSRSFDLTWPGSIKWCPVRRWTQSLRAGMTCSFSLPSHSVGLCAIKANER